MSTLNRSSVNTNLAEEFGEIGIDVKSGILGEAIASPVAPLGKPEQGSDENDPIEGKFVTRELMQRIANLPFESMSEEDFQQLSDELNQKELPEDDEELAELKDRVMSEAFKVIRTGRSGKKKRIRVLKGAEARKGKMYRRRMRAKIKRAKKRWKRSATGRRSKKAAEIRQKRFGENTETGSELFKELVGLVSESSAPSDEMSEHEVILDRIGNVFALIECLMPAGKDKEVSQVFEATYEGIANSLSEGLDDDQFLEQVKPALNVIKRCLEEIEALPSVEEEILALPN